MDDGALLFLETTTRRRVDSIRPSVFDHCNCVVDVVHAFFLSFPWRVLFSKKTRTLPTKKTLPLANKHPDRHTHEEGENEEEEDVGINQGRGGKKQGEKKSQLLRETY